MIEDVTCLVCGKAGPDHDPGHLPLASWCAMCLRGITLDEVFEVAEIDGLLYCRSCVPAAAYVLTVLP